MFSGIFLFKPYDTDSVVLSHKGGKYGKIFVLNYALKNGIKPDTIIYAGGRIVMMHMKGSLNIRFLYSLSFLSMALRKLPKVMVSWGFLQTVIIFSSYLHFLDNVIALLFYVSDPGVNIDIT